MKSKRIYLPVLCLMAALLMTVRGYAISPEALARGVPSLAPMLEKVTPAVVNIRVTKSLRDNTRYFYNGQALPDEIRRYFEDLPNFSRENRQVPYSTGAGSGVIIDASEGLVVTNHHVVAEASEITVQLSDNRNVKAELLGSDPGTDIALLRIEASDLVAIRFADIETVQVGDYVVAIGNPFGIGQTVTSGIVSALGRAGLNNENYEDFIQTDAAINVGNSGGALVDLEGNLIGINTAIISGNGGSNGVGFAVPGDMVASVMEHLERDGEVRRGMLGVSITNVTPAVTEALDLTADSGAVVTSVVPGSAAEAAGLEVSDIITAVDGRAVENSRDLRNMIGLMRQGEEVDLAVLRNAERLTLRATIGGAEGQALLEDRQEVIDSEFRGASLADSAAINGRNDTGVAVVEIIPQSPAYVAGLREGDVIVEINRRGIENLADFNAALEASNSITALTVVRDGRRLLVFVP